jgi:F-type H+-transporting ATPase subunit delta
MAAQQRPATLLDSAQLHLGRVYAGALLSAAEKAGVVEPVLDEFTALVTAVFDAVPPFENALSSPRIPIRTQRKILDRALRGKISDVLLEFLRVVVRHRRFDCLRMIHQQTLALYEEMEGPADVEIASASVLPIDLRQQIVEHLERVLKRPVRLKLQVDPDLIGGLVVRVGDKLYDGSVAGRLAELCHQVTEKTSPVIDAAFARHPIIEKA